MTRLLAVLLALALASLGMTLRDLTVRLDQPVAFCPNWSVVVVGRTAWPRKPIEGCDP